MESRTFDIEQRMKFLGWYQIIGAAISFFLLLKMLLYTGTLTGAKLLIISFAACFIAFSFYCGNLLRRLKEKGLTLSFWNQVIQILQISVWAVTFSYFSGLRFGLGFNWGEVILPDFVFDISGFHFRYDSDDTSLLSIYINFVPIVIIYYIGEIQKRIQEREELQSEAARLSTEFSES